MMDKEIKMKLLEALMQEMDDTAMSKFKKGDDIMPEGEDMVKVKEVKVDEVPVEKAPAMIKEKIAEAMKSDSMEMEDGEEEMEEEDDEEDYGDSRLMERLKKLKKG